MSGPEAITLTDRVFKPVSGKPLAGRAPYTLTFGYILTPEGEIIDEVLVSLFRAPHSYTGQDSTEISCHGSSYILQQVMQLLIRQGCRAAGPGEYTQRAFLNGKMDLSQAEAARRAGIPPSTLTARMTGRLPFTARDIAGLCKVLDIPADQIGSFFFEELPTSKKAG